MTNCILLCEVCRIMTDTIPSSCDVNNVELHLIFSSLFIQLALTAFFHHI